MTSIEGHPTDVTSTVEYFWVTRATLIARVSTIALLICGSSSTAAPPVLGEVPHMAIHGKGMGLSGSPLWLVQSGQTATPKSKVIAQALTQLGDLLMEGKIAPGKAKMARDFYARAAKINDPEVLYGIIQPGELLGVRGGSSG